MTLVFKDSQDHAATFDQAFWAAGALFVQEQPQPATDRALAEQLVERARAEGVELVGPGGLLTGLTKQVLETGLEVEMDEHLG